MSREMTLQSRASETPQEAELLRAREGVRVTWAAVAVNLLLTLTKAVGGILGGSQALLADALHSLSDLATDITVLFALRFSARPPDRDHPYGHGRIETAAAFSVGLVLLLAGVFLLFRSAADLWIPRPYRLSFFALPFLLVAIGLKEGLYWMTLHVGRRTDNQALIANAWHHRSDAISSVAALAGVALALMGHWRADALAAVVVAGLVIWVGVRVIRNSLNDLLDAAPPEEVLGRIRSAIAGVDGVRDVHALRVHRAGHRLFVDVHVEVASEISVADGHSIANRGQDSVLSQVEEVSEVHVHIEPHHNPNP